jgi:sirohydrochlorin cobaltochelatase
VSTAYLLIAHGSRDPRPQVAMNRLSQIVREHLGQKGLAESAISAKSPRSLQLVSPGWVGPRAVEPRSVKPRSVKHSGFEDGPGSRMLTSPARSQPFREPAIVGTAFLELGPLPLHKQIYEFGRRVQDTGISRLKLIPLFLMKGRHVVEDLPAEVVAARRLLGSAMDLELCQHLGSHPNMSELLAQKLATMPAEGQLLIAHGSRRPKGNRPVELLAHALGTTVAYWSTPPDLETQVINLMQQGCQRITILPYFLFTGGITDAITHLTEELAERFPRVSFRMLPPLGATPQLAKLAVDLAHPSQVGVLAS